MVGGQDPSLHQGSMQPDDYSGEFTTSTMYNLVKEVHELGDAPAQGYFAVLHKAVAAQGYHDMADAIERVSETSTGRLLYASYEPVLESKTRDKTIMQPAEQWARESIALGLGRALVDLYDLTHDQEHKRTLEGRTTTIADLQLNNGLHREMFVILARILAREPERLDASMPTPSGVTDVELTRVTPEDRSKGVVTLPGEPDKIVRFQKLTVDSTVPGFNFGLTRHNWTGHIRGNETDNYKLYLIRK